MAPGTRGTWGWLSLQLVFRCLYTAMQLREELQKAVWLTCYSTTFCCDLQAAGDQHVERADALGGAHAGTQGAQNHRGRQPTPKKCQSWHNIRSTKSPSLQSEGPVSTGGIA